jgi:hypothetical protein
MLNGKGELARLQGDYEAAERFYEESLALSRELGDQFGMCIVPMLCSTRATISVRQCSSKRV